MSRRLALLLILALLGACGSTVPPDQRAARSQQRSSEFGAPAAGDTDVTLPDGTPVGGNSSVTTRRGGTTRSGGSGSTSATTPGAFGPGVTNSTISIGLSYQTSNAANEAIGAGGLGQGDPKAQDQAMIDDLNTHGGIAGRKVVGVFHPVDGNSPAPWDVLDQQSCDDWTQDHKIFAALADPIADSDTMASCLDKRGVALISNALSTSDAARFRRLPAYVELTSMGLDRIAQAEVDALKAQNWFSGWDNVNGVPAQTKAKVGIVTFEGAAWSHAVDQVMVPALRALGHAPSPDDIVRVTPEHATQDISSTGAATSSAVLKLRGDNVTHVIVFDRKGTITLFFTRAADSQHYRPRYGFNSQNGPQALMTGAALPAEQLIGSKGLGWLPTLDLPTAVSASSAYTNDTKKKCLAVYKSKGITFSDPNAESIGMNGCSSWWFLRDAINASGGVLTRAGLLDGIARLGSSFLAANNFANRFSTTQHDGVGAYRHYAFDEACGCMKYTSSNIAAP